MNRLNLWIARVLTVGMIAAAVTACDSADTTSTPLDIETDSLPSEGPPPPPAGAFLAQMSPEQTSQLASLGVEVVVPGIVPPSFAIAELRVDQSEVGPAYLVVYQNSLNQCFAVEFAAQGIGDPPATESRTPIQPPLFGDQDYGLNHGPFADAAMRDQFPQPNLFTDWMTGPAGAYRLIGATYIGDLFEPLRGCEDVPIAEAVALAESLTVLTADPMGDPLESNP